MSASRKNSRYYLIISSSGKYAVSFSFSGNRYIGLANCSVFDFETREKFDCTETTVCFNKKMKFSRSEEKTCFSYNSKTCRVTGSFDGNEGRIFGKFKRCFNHTELEADIYLAQPWKKTLEATDEMGLQENLPWGGSENMCMTAGGYVKVNGRTYGFDKTKDYCFFSCATENIRCKGVYRQGMGCSCINGKPFAYKLSAASDVVGENNGNLIFYDGKYFKIGSVDFKVPEEDFTDEWQITSRDKRLQMNFTPFFNDHRDRNIRLSQKKAEFLFGSLSGTAVPDDGTEVKIENIPVLHKMFYKR